MLLMMMLYLYLGLQTCLDMNLVKRIHVVDENRSTPSTYCIIIEYKHFFSGIGCLPGECDIKVDPNVVPKVHPPRRIAPALKPKVKEELDRMARKKVVKKLKHQLHAWVNPIVVVEKPNGKGRICLDPRDLNQGILREHYPHYP